MIDKRYFVNILLFILVLFILNYFTTFAAAEETPERNVSRNLNTGWSLFLRGAFLHQFETCVNPCMNSSGIFAGILRREYRSLQVCIQVNTYKFSVGQLSDKITIN